MVAADIRYVDAEDGTALAYFATPAQVPRAGGGPGPGVVFLGGFMSDMSGRKATVLEAWARDAGRAFLRLDYSGHGASGGSARDGTIGRWRDDALRVIRHAGAGVAGLGGELVFVGSSMGAWIAALAALALARDGGPQRAAGLVTVAAAADFTAELLPARLGPEACAQIAERGVFEAPSEYSDRPYVVTRRLLEEGRDHLVLTAPLPLAIPARLIHGDADADVPWTQSQKLMAALASDDVQLILVKDGDHRLSEPRDLERMVAVVAGLCDQLASSSPARPAR